MLNNYLYVHLPLNTTTLPVLSLKADPTTTGEAMSMQVGNKQHPVSMVTASTDAGKSPKARSRSSTGSEDSTTLSMVKASSDRRHFWTDNTSVSRRSLDQDVGSTVTSSSQTADGNLSSSTPATPTFLSTTPPPSDVMFNPRINDNPTSSSTTTDIFSTPPSTPITAHTTRVATPSLPKPAGVMKRKRKQVAGGGLISYIKNLLWQFYQFLLILLKASFVPVSDRMIAMLAKEQETRSPLSNALLCFVTEVTNQTANKPWLCNERLQLGLLSLFGKQLDR